MSQAIQHYVPQGAIFPMELPLLGVRKYCFKDKAENEEIAEPYQRVLETYENNKIISSQIGGDPISMLIKEIKQHNKWDNSFDVEIQALIEKTDKLCLEESVEEAVIPRRKISRGLHKAQDAGGVRDIFAETEILFYEYPKGQNKFGYWEVANTV